MKHKHALPTKCCLGFALAQTPLSNRSLVMAQSLCHCFTCTTASVATTNAEATASARKLGSQFLARLLSRKPLAQKRPKKPAWRVTPRELLLPAHSSSPKHYNGDYHSNTMTLTRRNLMMFRLLAGTGKGLSIRPGAKAKAWNVPERASDSKR